ncbi:hypothetical protein [Actinoplanes sp. NBRC 103695]|uniref:hypothetical protein n=1 Tax=Actinoplanes sp. NBRC 103695 TaxID=3032202 RepID=UPI0024A25B8F|nr:hypothetical protein [Actinoplanes sp. NBRC 103695]GLY95227.1 hypothetical protein Acsp02_24820 [Actinoplanes sp. NBRC 103695]
MPDPAPGDHPPAAPDPAPAAPDPTSPAAPGPVSAAPGPTSPAAPGSSPAAPEPTPAAHQPRPAAPEPSPQPAAGYPPLPPGFPPPPGYAHAPGYPPSPGYPPPPGFPPPPGYAHAPGYPPPPGFPPPPGYPPGYPAPPGYPTGFAPPPAPPRKKKADVAVITVVVIAVLFVCGLGVATMSSVVSKSMRSGTTPDVRWTEICADPQNPEPFCAGATDPAEEPEPEPVNEDGYETALPTAGHPARPELAYAYVDRYQRLISSTAEPAAMRRRVADLHKGGFGSDRLIALRSKVRECDAVSDGGSWGVDLRPADTRVVSSGKGSVKIKMRLVERVPVCVTGARAGTAEQTQGTTDLELSFVTGKASDGRAVWLLSKLRATPVRPDPLSKAVPGSLGDDVARTDRTTIFTAVAS